MPRTLEEAEKIISSYEEDGAAKLYYSLRRKMNEMADLMNRTNLKSLDIADAKDKSFERLKGIWESSAKVAEAAKALGEAAGVTGDEKKDIERRPFIETIAEVRR